MRKRILVIISLLFSVVLNGCANKEKEKSELEKFLIKYKEVYPDGYNFQTGFYSITSFKKSKVENTDYFHIETYNIKAQLQSKPYGTLWNFEANMMQLNHSLVGGVGTEIPNENFENILWDGEYLHKTIKYNNGYVPKETWTEKTYGTNQIETLQINTEIDKIDYIISTLETKLTDLEKHVVNKSNVNFKNNSLIVSTFFSKLETYKIIRIDFDENFVISRYQISYTDLGRVPDELRLRQITQTLKPIDAIEVNAQLEYEEELIVEKDIFTIQI
jgi:hypothetical protein